MQPDSTLVYDPTSPSYSPPRAAPAALDTLAGKVVGFIDNSKPNFEHLAADLGALLKARFGVANVVLHRKRSASMSAGAAALDQLATECDIVITGSGD